MAGFGTRPWLATESGHWHIQSVNPDGSNINRNDSHLQLNFPFWFLASAESCGKNVLTAMAVSWERGATCESLSWHRFRQSLSPGKSFRTRPVSWLESASTGTHPRTKGARCSAGGRRHRIPSMTKGLLTARHGAVGQASGDPSSSTGASRSMASRQTRFVEKRPSHFAGPLQGSEMRTPLQKEACAGESRGAREVGPAVGNGRRGAGICRRQDALREARCLRGAPCLPVELSTGCVPLQSG